MNPECLFALAQRLFHLLALGDVTRDAEHRSTLARFVGLGYQPRAQPDFTPRQAGLIFQIDGLTGSKGCLHIRLLALTRLSGEERQGGHANDLRQGLLQLAGRKIVGVFNQSRPINDENHVVRSFGYSPEALFTHTQRRLHAFAFGLGGFQLNYPLAHRS